MHRHPWDPYRDSWGTPGRRSANTQGGVQYPRGGLTLNPNPSDLLLAMGRYGPGVTYTVPRRAIINAPPPMRPLFDFCHVMSFGLTNVPLQPHHALVT